MNAEQNTASTSPLQIRRVSPPEHDAGLIIRWTDGAETFVAAINIRKNCPCATCAEESGKSVHAKPLSPKGPSALRVIGATLEESVELKEIWGVGNYALGLRWGDGHDTGIYSYSLLRSLSEIEQHKGKNH